MVNVSRRKVKEDVSDRMFWLFFETMGGKKNKKDFDSIIKELLTPAERLTIAKRVTLAYMLLKNIDRDVIYETLKLSRSTISTYSLLLEHNDELKKSLQKLARKEKVKDLLVEFINEVYGPGTYGVNWSSAWKRKIAIEDKKRRGI